VVLQVVNVRVVGDERIAGRDVHPHDERAGLGGLVRRDADEHLALDFERGLAVRRRNFHTGQGTPDRLHTSE
jgi:hypothetical protein